MAKPISDGKFKDLPKRIVTAALFAGVAFIALLQGDVVFTLFIAVCSIIMVHEWRGMTANLNRWMSIVGIPYILFPCLSLIGLRMLYFDTPASISIWPSLFVIAVVVATDTGAYIAGRAIGGPKLAPTISPGKTWSGLIGGMGCGVVTSILLGSYVPVPQTLIGAMALGMVLSVVSQLGDLFESWVKRKAKVKDSGNLLPGHGGLLDRVDGLLFAAPLYFIFNLIAGGRIL